MNELNWSVRTIVQGAQGAYGSLICLAPDRATACSLAALWTSAGQVEVAVYVFPRVGAEVEIDRFAPPEPGDPPGAIRTSSRLGIAP